MMKRKLFTRILSVTAAVTMAAGVSYGFPLISDAEAPSASLPAVQKLTNDSTLSADAIIKGDSVTVNAAASGGSGSYTYAVLYKKQSGTKWAVQQNYQENAVVSVTPAAAVDYDICVKAKDSSGTIAKKYFTLKVNTKLKNTSTISKTSLAAGETITVNASATGGIGKYTYSVLYKKMTGQNWTVKQNNKENTTVTIKPAIATDYSVCVKVRDENGGLSKKYFTLTVFEDTASLYAQEVIKLVNEERQKVGLAPYTVNPTLMQAAAVRAQELTESYSHTRPDGTSCFTVLKDFNLRYSKAGENIARGQSSPAVAMRGWMNSEGHRNNILSDEMTHIGVAMCSKNGVNCWVQIFVKNPY